MFRTDAIVIGAGVVGLAVARALALSGREVIVLESEARIGDATSSRNSEVIHAGLYYPTGSLKARLCVAGREALYPYCEAHGVPHRRCGKLVVATAPGEDVYLESLAKKAHANGVGDVRLVSGAELRRLEPDLNGINGLISPSTGIVDSHSLMLAYRGDAEDAGAAIVLRAPVLSGSTGPRGARIATGGDEPAEIEADIVVNAAGLGAWDVSNLIAGLDKAQIPPRHYVKGSYFALTGRAPFRHLVYPVPEPGGLGVHLTLDLAGRARFGPDVEPVEAIDYAVDPDRSLGFYAAIRRYWPGLPDGSLAPAYSGIRPKVSAADQPAADFIIQGPAETGQPGYVALYGIESPGLTASLAIADAVAAKLG